MTATPVVARTLDTLRANHVKATAEADRLEQLLATAGHRSNAATPGGLHDYDPAILSGIRRKPNPKADARRWAAYDREAELTVAHARAVEQRDRLAKAITRAERDATAPRDLDTLKPGDAVRDSTGWHRVVRVNAKTVTVETGYSWTDRIPTDRIIETRSIA